MTNDRAQRHRAMRNYRGMFRVAVVFVAISLVATVVGGVKTMMGGDAMWIVYPVLFLIFSVGSAYLTIDSTVRIIDVEMEEARGR